MKKSKKESILCFTVLYWIVLKHFSDLKETFYNDLFPSLSLSLDVYIHTYRQRERETVGRIFNNNF